MLVALSMDDHAPMLAHLTMLSPSFLSNKSTSDLGNIEIELVFYALSQ
jgi:hypothetical protein